MTTPSERAPSASFLPEHPLIKRAKPALDEAEEVYSAMRRRGDKWTRGIRVTVTGPYETDYVYTDVLQPGTEEIVVGTLFSKVSLGTERQDITGEDMVRQGRNAKPPKLGYMEYGRVLVPGAGLHVGDPVSHNGGRGTLAIANYERYEKGKWLAVSAEGVEPLIAPELAQMGGIALNPLAWHDAFTYGQRYFLDQKENGEPIQIGKSLEGKHVLVIGAGTVGFEHAIFLQDAGAIVSIAGFGPNMYQARSLGMEVFNPDQLDNPEGLVDKVKQKEREDGVPRAEVISEVTGTVEGFITAAMLQPEVILDLSFYHTPTPKMAMKKVAVEAEYMHKGGVHKLTTQIGHPPRGLDRVDFARAARRILAQPRYAHALMDQVSHIIPISEFDVFVHYLKEPTHHTLDAMHDWAVNPPSPDDRWHHPAEVRQVMTYMDLGIFKQMERRDLTDRTYGA